MGKRGGIYDPTGRSIVKTFRGEDGHIYYVIAADKSRIAVGVQFLDNYTQLINDHAGEPGLFFVRNAASVVETDDNGVITNIVQNGDPTVHRGWAVYTWYGHKLGPDRGGWYKIAEQESVDGPWGIDEVILKSLVPRSEFNLFKVSISAQVTNNTNNIQTIQQTIINIGNSIEELNRLKHSHGNKEVLDKLADQGGQLVYNGKIVSGSTLLYDNVEDGKLYWVDPTFSPTDETPEFEPIECENSYAVATKFAQCSMAAVGLTIEVVEVNGSISRYDIIKNDEGTLVPVFRDSTVQNSYGTLNIVDTLPEASIAYDNRGIWYPIMDDGVHLALTPYTSKNGEWITMEQYIGAGKLIGQIGAIKTAAFIEEDPSAPYKKNRIVWKEPSGTYTDPTTGTKYTWGKTVLVRKYGSVPANAGDGTVVFTNTVPGSAEYTDICPYGGADQVFYRLFSFTRVGAIYTADAGFTPEYPSWADLFAFIRNNPLDAVKVIKVGDKVVLPDHPVFGDIVCSVINVSAGKIVTHSDNILDVIKYTDFDAWKSTNFTSGFTKYLKCRDGRKISGKDVFVFDASSGYVALELEDGEEFPEGTIVYERNTEFENGIVSSVSIPSIRSGYDTPGVENIPTLLNQSKSKDAEPYWMDNVHICLSNDTEHPTAANTPHGVVCVFNLSV